MAPRKASLCCSCMHRYQPPSDGWYEHLSDQVGYLAHEGTALFTQGGALEGTEARALLAAATGQHVAFHRLILSLSPSSGLRSRADVQPWTRALLADLGDRLQRDLIYVAAAHQGTGVLHSHVLIGGRASVRGTPRGADVVLRLADCAYLRTQGTEQARALAARNAGRRAELARYTHTYRSGAERGQTR